MCLRIDDRIKRPTSPIMVYKCLVDNGDDRLDGRFTSPMHGPHKWTLGENVSDRESVELTPREVDMGIVEKGFHFYLDRPTDPSVVGGTIIITVEVQLEHIVAMGFHTRYPSLVATQCVWGPLWNPPRPEPPKKVKPGDILTDEQIAQCEFKPIVPGDLVIATLGDGSYFKHGEVVRVNNLDKSGFTCVDTENAKLRAKFEADNVGGTWYYSELSFKRVPDDMRNK